MHYEVSKLFEYPDAMCSSISEKLFSNWFVKNVIVKCRYQYQLYKSPFPIGLVVFEGLQINVNGILIKLMTLPLVKSFLCKRGSFYFESHLNTKHNDNLQGGTNSKNVTLGMLYHSSIQKFLHI